MCHAVKTANPAARTAAALLLLAVAAFLFLRQSRPVLVLEDRQSGAQWQFVLPQGEFTLGYTHSVMKTPVQERYRADRKDGLVMEETVYQSYGVGLPFLPEEGELVVEDGLFYLRMDRVVGRLHMTLSDIPGHTLSIGDTSYDLRALLGDGRQLALYVQYQRFWRFWTPDAF